MIAITLEKNGSKVLAILDNGETSAELDKTQFDHFNHMPQVKGRQCLLTVYEYEKCISENVLTHFPVIY